MRVTDIDRQHSYVTAPEKAARETDFYSLADEQINPDAVPPLLMETMLSQVEGWAVGVMDTLIAHGVDELSDEARMHLAVFLAFQLGRGRAKRGQIQQMVNTHFQISFEHYTDDDIRAHLGRVGAAPTDEEIRRSRQFLDDVQAGTAGVASPRAQAIALAMASTEQAAEALYEREWLVFRAPPILVTCDEPVVIIGGPGHPRDEQAGLLTAGVIVFPLGPSRLLAMFKPGITIAGTLDLSHVEVADLNREILASTHITAFERPARHVAERLKVPPAPKEASMIERFQPADPNEEGELIRNFTVNRWRGHTPVPSWPVERWWH